MLSKCSWGSVQTWSWASWIYIDSNRFIVFLSCIANLSTVSLISLRISFIRCNAFVRRWCIFLTRLSRHGAIVLKNIMNFVLFSRFSQVSKFDGAEVEKFCLDRNLLLLWNFLLLPRSAFPSSFSAFITFCLFTFHFGDCNLLHPLHISWNWADFTDHAASNCCYQSFLFLENFVSNHATSNQYRYIRNFFGLAYNSRIIFRRKIFE